MRGWDVKIHNALKKIVKTYFKLIPSTVQVAFLLSLTYYWEHSFQNVIKYLIEMNVLFYIGDLGTDSIHAFYHLLAKSRFRLLRKIGSIHYYHHRFLNTSMKYNERYTLKNFYIHEIPELLTHYAIIGMFYFIFGPIPVLACLLGLDVMLATKYKHFGKNGIHQEKDEVLPAKTGIVSDPEYHALHHIHSDSFYGGDRKTIDYLLGTGCYLAGKKFIVTSKGPLGQALKTQLLGRSAKSVELLNLKGRSNLEKIFEGIDVLILSHHLEEENKGQKEIYESYTELTQAFMNTPLKHLYPKEIWAFGQNSDEFEVFGASCYESAEFVYRHLVYFDFYGDVWSPEAIAKRALFFVRRGFHFIPINSMAKWYFKLKEFSNRVAQEEAEAEAESEAAPKEPTSKVA